MKDQPERYQDSRPLTPVEVLSVLRTYLSDALNKTTKEKKRIAVRNKRFLLAFSDECDDIFEYLEFELQLEKSSDGVRIFIQRMKISYTLYSLFCTTCNGSEPACVEMSNADQVVGNTR